MTQSAWRRSATGEADADTIAASLQGTWREEHLFALEQAMQRYDFLTQQIDDCEARVMAEIERLTPPDDLPDGGAPDHAPGTTASSRSANAATNDTGREGIQPLALRKMMGRPRSPKHFCSWLALAPGTRIGKIPGKTPQALRMAAMAARRSQTFIGAKHRARLARMDTPVAIKRGTLPRMVTEGQEYVEQGIGEASNYTGKEGALALRGMFAHRIPTIGRASEIGPDFSAFPSAQHFCSWLARAGNQDASERQEPPRQVPECGQSSGRPCYS